MRQDQKRKSENKTEIQTRGWGGVLLVVAVGRVFRPTDLLFRKRERLFSNGIVFYLLLRYLLLTLNIMAIVDTLLVVLWNAGLLLGNTKYRLL